MDGKKSWMIATTMPIPNIWQQKDRQQRAANPAYLALRAAEGPLAVCRLRTAACVTLQENALLATERASRLIQIVYAEPVVEKADARYATAQEYPVISQNTFTIKPESN